MKQNISTSTVHLTKAEAGYKASVTCPCNVSHGGLPSIALYKKGNRLVSSLRFPKEFEITEATSVGEATAALLQCNVDWEDEDELAIIYLEQRFSNVAEFPALPRVRATVYRFPIDRYSAVLFRAVVPAEVFDIIAGHAGTQPGLAPGGVAYVHIRREFQEKTKISTEQIAVTPNNNVYPLYSSLKKAVEAADSYGRPEVSIYEPAANRRLREFSEEEEEEEEKEK